MHFFNKTILWQFFALSIFFLSSHAAVAPDKSIAYIPTTHVPGNPIEFNVLLKDTNGNTVTPSSSTRSSTRWTISAVNQLSCAISTGFSVSGSSSYHVIESTTDYVLASTYYLYVKFDNVDLINSGTLIRLYTPETAANWGTATMPSGTYAPGDTVGGTVSKWSMTMKNSQGTGLPFVCRLSGFSMRMLLPQIRVATRACCPT